MKELSIKEKAKAYDEAKVRMSRAYNSNRCTIGFMNEIFPELAESEDERIRKELIKFVKVNIADEERYIAWLEKQGEQKPSKDEPKFKVGDWITNGATKPAQISSIEDDMYYTHNGTIGGDIESMDKDYHLWTIADAKDGDVLSDGTTIFIFKDLLSDDSVISHCDYDTDSGKGYVFCPLSMNLTCSKITPATKEQCNLLFQKIKENGYEWDAEKKELKKIEQKPTQETKPFKVEHGKYYYCIKDCFCGGRKQASKGDVVQALRGLPIMGLKNASEYFLPVNFIKEIW